MPHWILRGHEPVETEDALEWGLFFSDSGKCRVAETIVGTAKVSTVFLGIDHSFGSEGPPILFESMIFEGPKDLNERAQRYSTWDEAVAGHAGMVGLLRERLGIPEPPPPPEPPRTPGRTAWERLTADDDD